MSMFGHDTLEQRIWDAIEQADEAPPTYKELILAIGKVLEAYASFSIADEKGER